MSPPSFSPETTQLDNGYGVTPAGRAAVALVVAPAGAGAEVASSFLQPENTSTARTTTAAAAREPAGTNGMRFICRAYTSGDEIPQLFFALKNHFLRGSSHRGVS